MKKNHLISKKAASTGGRGKHLCSDAKKAVHRSERQRVKAHLEEAIKIMGEIKELLYKL